MNPTVDLGIETTVHLPQGPVRVYERGQGAAIVFVHGLVANAAAWRRVVPALAQEYRCVTADWPFGSHYAPLRGDADLTPPGLARTIADTIAALGLDDVTLVGNDGGGMLCQLVAVNHPERIGRLVLTPCDAYENFPPRMFDYLCWAARVPGALALLAQALRLRAVRRLPNAYGWLSHTRIPDEILDHYTTPLRNRSVRRDTAKFLRAVDRRYTLDAARCFGDFDRPVLVAWAADDRFFPLAHAHRFATDFPDARLELIVDSRTYVAEDQPEHLAEVIRAFAAATSTTTEHVPAAD